MPKTNLLDILKQKWAGLSTGQKELYFFLVLLGFTWVIGKYMAVGPYTRDNGLVTNVLCLVFVFHTVGLYYLFGDWIFPKFLYRRRVAVFILLMLLTFLAVYWSNYFLLGELIKISNSTTQEGKSTWIGIIWPMLEEAGWLGCFTNGVVAFWNYGFSCEIATIYLTFKIFGDILAHRENKQKLEKENLELELHFLRSRINPHFFFNTLNSIFSRTVGVNEEASEMTLKLAELMRYSLYRTGNDRVLLSDELKYIQNYLDLEKFRYSKSLLEITFDADEWEGDYQIAPLLLVPLVENAFKHGISQGGNPSFVKVSAVIEDNTLYFSVDNSLPVPPNRSAQFGTSGGDGGIGLVTLRRRLALIYPEKHHFLSKSLDDRYEVMLSIPLERA